MIKHAFVRLSLSLFSFYVFVYLILRLSHIMTLTSHAFLWVSYMVSCVVVVVFMLANRCLFALGRLWCMDLVQLSDDLVQLSDDLDWSMLCRCESIFWSRSCWRNLTWNPGRSLKLEPRVFSTASLQINQRTWWYISISHRGFYGKFHDSYPHKTLNALARLDPFHPSCFTITCQEQGACGKNVPLISRSFSEVFVLVTQSWWCCSLS